jgi:DNA adenine methylase
MPYPILKWVGGKTQLLSQILPLFPTQITNYYEPFVGGASVLIAVAPRVTGRCVVGDINAPLIQLYNDIKTNPEPLYQKIQALAQQYHAAEDPAALYYQIRTLYNATPLNLDKSAMLVFLNKTCFRGLYREGPNGFNVPFGNYKKPVFVEHTNLMELNALFANVEFIHGDYTVILDSYQSHAGDWLYLDPPYVPTAKNSFVYGGFDTHQRLFDKLKTIGHWMMSNSDAPELDRNFPPNEWEVYEIDCRRTINSKNPGSSVIELLIRKE